MLHWLCASARFFISLGCPPFDIGTIWSITALKGCGYFNFLSTGPPHILQVSCVANILFLLNSYCTLWLPLLSGLRGLFFIVYPFLCNTKETAEGCNLFRYIIRRH